MKLIDHFEKLKYFYYVAKNGSLNAATTQANVSQPSLTKSIKILESVIGNDLFIRLPSGMKLTSEGDILYKYCQEIFNSIVDIEQRLAQSGPHLSGSLQIGTYDSIGIYFWPSFLQKFLTKYDLIDIRLVTGRSKNMQEQLELGELDLTLTIDPQANRTISVEFLKMDEFQFYQTTQPLKVYKTEKEAPIIIMPTNTIKIDSLKEELNLTQNKVYLTSSLESVKELTSKGIGIGLLPKMVAQSLLKGNLIQEVSFPTQMGKKIAPHSLSIAYHKSRENSPLIKLLVKEIKESTHWHD